MAGGGGEVDAVAVAGEVGVVQEAAGVAAVADVVFGGEDLRAGVEDVRAAGMEAAAVGWVGEVGWLARHRCRRLGIVEPWER